MKPLTNILLTKTETMKLISAGRIHENFEHSEQGLIDVTAMREQCKAGKFGPPLEIGLDQIIPFIHEHRVFELDRVKELDAESWQHDPGIFVIVYERCGISHLMIDGTHRALRRRLEGLDMMLFYMIPQEHIIRPAPGFVQLTDWGDSILQGGKIVKRGEEI